MIVFILSNTVISMYSDDVSHSICNYSVTVERGYFGPKFA